MGGSRGRSRNALMCGDTYHDYCHMQDHIEGKCWQKDGRPNWAKQLNNATSASSNVPNVSESTSTIMSPVASNSISLSNKDFENMLKMAQGDKDLPSATFAQAETSTHDNTPKSSLID